MQVNAMLKCSRTGMLTLVALAACACAPQDECVRRPYLCSSANSGDTGGTGGGGGGGGSGGSGSTVLGGTGTCDSYMPPTFAALTANTKLPDPFLGADGTRMTSQSQWPCRRAEI